MIIKYTKWRVKIALNTTFLLLAFCKSDNKFAQTHKKLVKNCFIKEQGIENNSNTNT